MVAKERIANERTGRGKRTTRPRKKRVKPWREGKQAVGCGN